MTPATIRSTIADAIALTGRICDLATYVHPRSNAQDMLQRACEQSLAVEREHRRFTSIGRARGYHGGYHVGAALCADMFVAQRVAEFVRPQGKLTAIESSSYRADVLTCMAIGQVVYEASRARLDASGRNPEREASAQRHQSELKRLLKKLKSHPVLEIDYARDCAR